MNDTRYQSWGRYPQVTQSAVCLHQRRDTLPLKGHDGKSFLPFGNGRSYGDSCLNDGGVLLVARGLDRIIRFDPENGILRCEAGVLLSEILASIVPRGWFLPVTPGTQFVTVGGAIANDVHGKNHHKAGTFGCHVRCFELLRSDGSRLLCSATENPDWFQATIGGLGLTGVIVWAELALRRIANPYIQQETIRYAALDDFFHLSQDSDQGFEYTVAWVDCLARGRSLGRGLFMRGNHAPGDCAELSKAPRSTFTFPLEPPFSLINRTTLKAFNFLYYHKQRKPIQKATIHYEPFFYPLDGIRKWNRMYGPRGLFQYQCVIPVQQGQDAIKEILQRIAASGEGSFLAVLKMFGNVSSPGLLSFPRPGVTLALDFCNRGEKTFRLLESLDEVVAMGKGAVYPAKDARMSGASFQRYYPQWQQLEKYIDPHFSSSFWRRVTGEAR